MQGPPLAARCAGSAAQGEGETLLRSLVVKGCWFLSLLSLFLLMLPPRHRGHQEMWLGRG